jgi:hypothetical protein
MALPWGQDEVADAVLSAKPGSIVILQTGSAVSMPWRDKAGAILQAWYQGQAGATAVAEIIAGKTNPQRPPAGDLVRSGRADATAEDRRCRDRASFTVRIRGRYAAPRSSTC